VCTSEHFTKLARALYFVTKICTFFTHLLVPVLPIFDLTFLAAIMSQFASGTACKAKRVMLFRIQAILLLHLSQSIFLGPHLIVENSYQSGRGAGVPDFNSNSSMSSNSFIVLAPEHEIKTRSILLLRELYNSRCCTGVITSL